jgi:hypothetical protein
MRTKTCLQKITKSIRPGDATVVAFDHGKSEGSSVKCLNSILLSTLLAFSLNGPVNAAEQPIMSAEMIERVRDRFIFVFHDSVAPGDVAQESRRLMASYNGRLIHTYSHTIRGFAARVPAEAAARMASNNPHIAYFEQDQIAYPFPPPWCADNPNDPRCGGDDGGGDDSAGTNPTQQTPWGITRVNGGTGIASGTAWIIDTGVDLDHPDLNVDTGRSKNFVTKGKDNGGDDPDGHGTHVAGTIAAIDNSIGVIGVAPGAAVVSVRVLGRNGGTYSDVIAGVDHVGAHGQSGDVANMSLGGGKSDALNTAVEHAAYFSGTVFVIAAGNSSADAGNYSPASANGPNVVTVAAFAKEDDWASYSNYGRPPIDWIAPGSSVLSTYKNGDYATLSGTSMAAPHVAGVILLGVCSDLGSITGPDGSYPVCTH